MSKETNLEIEVTPNESNTEVQNDSQDNENNNEDELEIELEDEDQTNEGEEEPEDELEETDYEGKKYKVHKEIKAALLRQADYTKKTQEIAEKRKSIDAEKTQISKDIEEKTRNFEIAAEALHLNKQIAAYKDVNWQKLIDEDPQAFMKLDYEYKTLVTKRDQRLNEIRQKEQERSGNEQREIAKREEETRLTLNRDIKGWGTDLESKITEYAKKNEISDDVIKRAVKSDPVAVKMLHKAFLYDQLVEKALQKKPRIVPIPEPVKSLKPRTSRADSSSAPSDRDSVDVWLQKREKQLRARNLNQ